MLIVIFGYNKKGDKRNPTKTDQQNRRGILFEA